LHTARFKDRAGSKVDVTGGWAVVIKIENEELRKKYRTGEWDGVSMAGPGRVENLNKEDTLANKFLSMLQELFTKRMVIKYLNLTILKINIKQTLVV
jgi:hypothetical protein